MNRVILVGRLARDPEIRYTQSGKAVARFPLAVDRRFSRKAEENGQPTADFINIIAWDKLAEICGNNLAKGRRVGVEGRIQTGSYEDKDGKRVYTTDVVISEMEFLDSKNDGNNGAGQGGYRKPAGGNSGFGESVPESEIPF